MKEYKTVLLVGGAPKQQIQLNELAKEGWQLVSVSYNVAYLERNKGTQVRFYGQDKMNAPKPSNGLGHIDH